MKIQGRKCTLTVLKDNEFIPLPYSEETVRLTSKGYTLPSCIGRRNRLKRIETGKLIQGCFVTRLEYLFRYYMNTEYLEKFFRNLLLGESNELRNRYCHIKYSEKVAIK